MKSPEEVKKAISANFKIRGLTHEAAAKKIGVIKRQTLSNLLFQKKYLSFKQASVFHHSFGYNMSFLMYGEGNLFGETEIQENENGLELIKLYSRRIIQAWGHPEALKIINLAIQCESCNNTERFMALITEIEKIVQHLEAEKNSKSEN